MATRAVSATTRSNDIMTFTWSGLLNGDDGSPVEVPWMSEKCVHIFGTFGAGGSVSFRGTNRAVVDLPNDIVLRDPQAVALTFTSAGLKQVLENPLLVYPYCTAGDGTTNMTCVLLCKAQINI